MPKSQTFEFRLSETDRAKVFAAAVCLEISASEVLSASVVYADTVLQSASDSETAS